MTSVGIISIIICRDARRCVSTVSFIIGMLLLTGSKCCGQYDNVWAFGFGAGIDFNTVPPQPISTAIDTREGSASICDANGQLLFYTDGTSVWDRNNTIMPNGTNLTETGTNITISTTQGALIVPVPSSGNQYYLFSLGGSGSSGKLYYSIVDMSLNGGLGDVITKGNILDSLLTEHMTAVSGNDCNVWLLVLSHSDTTSFLKAYDISINGISPYPVLSQKVEGGGSYQGILGSIDVSPDRSKLAIAQGNLVLYDFDVDLGKILNPLILDLETIPPNIEGYYGVCFSPDDSKLYASTNEWILQFDLSLDSEDSIIASKMRLGQQAYGAIKRAPDGKIYGASELGNTINVINQPNRAGLACQFVAGGFTLAGGTRCRLGLPNSGMLFFHRKAYSSTVDSTLCSAPRSLVAKDLSGQNYVWGDSTFGPTRVVDTPGLYWVRYQVMANTPCTYELYEIHVDTFRVVFRFMETTIHASTMDSGMCKGDPIILRTEDQNGGYYIWDNGDTGNHRVINQPGVFWVTYRIDSLCENHIDTFIVTYPEKDYEVSFLADTLVCANDVIQFQNTSDPHFNQFNWSFDDGNSSLLSNPEYTYAEAGSYDVRLVGKIDSICPDTAYQTIIVDAPPVPEFEIVPKEVCLGQPVYFYPHLDSTTGELVWELSGQFHSETSIQDRYQHAFDAAGRLPVTLSIYPRVCPDTSYTDTVTVYPLPEVDLGPDSSICLHGQPIYLKNLHSAPLSPYHQVWSSGDTTEVLKVVHPGIYTLSVSMEPLGCTMTESITISKDCYIDVPNAFTPDGDGHNDFFFPRQLLSQNLSWFKMQVFNRWGQVVFETNRLDGRGWDGYFNGKAQPMGVYLYRIEANFVNGRQESYAGNVTLLR